MALGGPRGWVDHSCLHPPRTCGRAWAWAGSGTAIPSAGRHFLPRARLCQAEGRRLAALVLGPPGQFPELIPEEHAEDGVGTQAQVGGAQTLVERQGALLPPDLHQAVGEAAIQPALGTDTGQTSLQASWGPGWHNGVCLCVRASVAPQKGHSPKLGKSRNSNPSGCES